MGFKFSLTNIYRSTYLLYGLTIIYFIPAFYCQYVDTDDCRILLPPVFVYVFTYVHQLLLNSPAIPFRFPYQIDLLLTVLEMAAHITIWHLSSSSAFLSLAVFDLLISCILFLIGCLKLGDVITDSGSRRGPWDLGAKYDPLTVRPWSKKDDKRANRKLTFLFSSFIVGLFVYFTIAFAWNTIITAPIRETVSTPLKASKPLHRPSEDIGTRVLDVWNVIVTPFRDSIVNLYGQSQDPISGLSSHVPATNSFVSTASVNTSDRNLLSTATEVVLPTSQTPHNNEVAGNELHPIPLNAVLASPDDSTSATETATEDVVIGATEVLHRPSPYNERLEESFRAETANLESEVICEETDCLEQSSSWEKFCEFFWWSVCWPACACLEAQTAEEN